MKMNTNKHKGLNISIQNSSRRHFGVLVSHPVKIRTLMPLVVILGVVVLPYQLFACFSDCSQKELNE